MLTLNNILIYFEFRQQVQKELQGCFRANLKGIETIARPDIEFEKNRNDHVLDFIKKHGGRI